MVANHSYFEAALSGGAPCELNIRPRSVVHACIVWQDFCRAYLPILKEMASARELQMYSMTILTRNEVEVLLRGEVGEFRDRGPACRRGSRLRARNRCF